MLSSLNGSRIIAGDFNINLLGDNYNSKTICAMMKKYGFVQIVQEPTTERATLIDHI